MTTRTISVCNDIDSCIVAEKQEIKNQRDNIRFNYTRRNRNEIKKKYVRKK